MTQFQNSIAFGTFKADGGEVTNLVALEYVDFLFTADPTKYNKNIGSGQANKFEITCQQNGMYWVDFSFMSGGGDGKTYYTKPYVNDILYDNDMTIQFYQQPSTQEYEVSMTCLIKLQKGDTLCWKIYVPTISGTTYFARDLKYTIYSLQQLGIH
jgi:hypothetical protein